MDIKRNVSPPHNPISFHSQSEWLILQQQSTLTDKFDLDHTKNSVNKWPICRMYRRMEVVLGR